MAEETNNMELWDRVCKTDPKDTKPFKGKGGFQGTAIAAQSQRKKATELWGSFGNEWGIQNEKFEIISLSEDHHDKIITYSGELYYPNGSFGIHSDLDVWMYAKTGKYWIRNNDMYKKVRTDAFTKGLSELGFNADVFMGLFDDNKYVAEMTEAFNRPESIRKDQINEIKKLVKDAKLSDDDLKKRLAEHFEGTTEVSNLYADAADKLIRMLKLRIEHQEKNKDGNNNGL